MKNSKLIQPIIKFLVSELGGIKAIGLIVEKEGGGGGLKGADIDYIEDIKLALADIDLNQRKEEQRKKTRSAGIKTAKGMLGNDK